MELSGTLLVFWLTLGRHLGWWTCFILDVTQSSIFVSLVCGFSSSSSFLNLTCDVLAVLCYAHGDQGRCLGLTNFFQWLMYSVAKKSDVVVVWAVVPTTFMTLQWANCFIVFVKRGPCLIFMCGKQAHLALRHASIVFFFPKPLDLRCVTSIKIKLDNTYNPNMSNQVFCHPLSLFSAASIFCGHGGIFVKVTMTKYCFMGNYFLCRTNTGFPHSRDSLVFCLQPWFMSELYEYLPLVLQNYKIRYYSKCACLMTI